MYNMTCAQICFQKLLYPITQLLPKRETQLKRKAAVQDEADMSLRGMASNHLVVQSIMVKMY